MGIKPAEILAMTPRQYEAVARGFNRQAAGSGAPTREEVKQLVQHLGGGV